MESMFVIVEVSRQLHIYSVKNFHVSQKKGNGNDDDNNNNNKFSCSRVPA